jgi:glyoxylase-like metal-dependent hydrolase (beta-lactamase superfamily II)
MRIRQYGTVYQLTFLPRAFPINCYLVEEDTELTLIDAGMPFSSKGILKAAEKIGKPITRIVLTHGHEDHVGALALLAVGHGNVITNPTKVLDQAIDQAEKALR